MIRSHVKGAGFAGKAKPAGRVLEQCAKQSEKSDEKRRWAPRGLDYTPLASRARERVVWMQSEGYSSCPQAPGGGGRRWPGREAWSATLVSGCPGSGREEVTWLQRPGHGDPAATPSLAGTVPRRRGGGVCCPSQRSRPSRPPLPARCGARSPARSPTLTSPAAPAAPPLPGAPPPTPGRKSRAGSESRGAQRVGTRGSSAPGTGSDHSPHLQAVLEPV